MFSSNADSGQWTSGPVRQWTGRYTSTTVLVPVDSGQSTVDQWTSATVDRWVHVEAAVAATLRRHVSLVIVWWLKSLIFICD